MAMHLLLFTVEGNQQLSEEETRKIVRSIYIHHYLLDPDSQFIQDVLQSVGKASNPYLGGGR